LKAWAESLGGITYPLLSDFYPHGQVAQIYGVLRSDGRSERAIFVIDKKGIIRYVDVHDIDQQPDNEVLFHVLSELEPEAALDWRLKQRQPAGQSTPQVPEPSGEPRVVLYCTPWCPDCKTARVFLKKHFVPFAEVDISRDREAAARLREWTGGVEETPTFQIGETILVNYDPARLARALEIDV
jgi:glutaredoxin